MKAITILKKEYREIVRKKSFIISTILTPIIMAAFMFLPMILMKVGKGEIKVAVADFSGFVYPELAADLKELETIKLQVVEVSGREPGDLVREFESVILKKEVDALLLIPETVRTGRQLAYYALNVSDFETNRILSSQVRSIISRRILVDEQIDPKVVDEATRDVQLATFKVKRDGTTQTTSGLEYMMSIFMLAILMSIIMAYGQLIMRGILEEKGSRIMEVLISSTNAQQLFYGKVLGIGLAGLTQVLIWMILAVALIGQFSFGLDAGITGFITLELGIYFVLFFVLGYFMYAIMFATLGAAVNTDQEAQQFSAPIIYMIMIPFFLGIVVTQNPNTPLALIASLVPFFTPILMFMRITVSMPPFLQILAGIGLTLLTIVGLAWVGARIFRTGILMYGKKPNFKEMLRWMRYG